MNGPKTSNDQLPVDPGLHGNFARRASGRLPEDLTTRVLDALDREPVKHETVRRSDMVNAFTRYAHDGVALSDSTLRKIYYKNAERLFGIKVEGWKPAKPVSFAMAPKSAMWL